VGKKIQVEEQAFTRAVGQRAARLRKERGITQIEMAKQLGVSQPHVSLIESGETRLHGEMVARLAGVLGVSADVLLGIVPLKGRSSSPERGKFWKAFQLAAQLPERDQRAVARLISSPAAGQSR